MRTYNPNTGRESDPVRHYVALARDAAATDPAGHYIRLAAEAGK